MNKSLSSGRLLLWFGVFLKLHLLSLMVSIAVAQLTVGILAAIAVLMFINGYRYRRTIIDIPLLLFVAVRIVAIVMSEYPAMSVVTLTRELVFYADYFSIVFYLQNVKTEEQSSLLRWLFASTAIVCVIAVAQVLLGVVERAHSRRMSAW
jgi:hypothetical protein